MPHNFFTTEDVRQMRADDFHNKTFIEIRTGTQTFADGVPTFTWVTKESRYCDFMPVSSKDERLEVQVGGEKFAVEYKVFIDLDTDIIVGNRLTSNSGTTEYQVLTINSYDDHKELLLREVRN